MKISSKDFGLVNTCFLISFLFFHIGFRSFPLKIPKTLSKKSFFLTVLIFINISFGIIKIVNPFSINIVCKLRMFSVIIKRSIIRVSLNASICSWVISELFCKEVLMISSFLKNDILKFLFEFRFSLNFILVLIFGIVNR